MDKTVIRVKHSHQNSDHIQLLNNLNTRGSEQGFSLIEVMIAMVVLLMGMLGVMSMQYYAVGGNSSSRELRIATNMSGDLLEVMKSTDYANIAANTDAPLAVGEASLSGGVNFTRRWWVIANCAALPAGNGPVPGSGRYWQPGGHQ